MPPAEVKAALAVALGPNAEPYWRTLSDFLQGKMSRAEFEDLMSERLNTPHLKHLHNTLLLEIIGAACTSEPDTLTTNTIIPTNKRRRIHPYQGNEDDIETYHSARLKSWIVSLPKVERHDIKTQGSFAEKHLSDKRNALDEVTQERGYDLNSQARPPQSALSLCAMTRTLPSLPDLHQRVSATCLENGITFTSATTKTLTPLFNQALEEFLIKIITATLTTITRSDTQYESIQAPSNQLSVPTSIFQSKPANSTKATISVMSLATTFYVTPSLVSFPSPAVLRLFMQEFQWLQDETDTPNKDKDKDKGHRDLPLGAKPLADYYRLVRASRSGGPVSLQEYPVFQ